MNITIKNCPGTLAPGYSTYSGTALRRMFDNKKVSHWLDFSVEGNALVEENRIHLSISGVQEKMSAVVRKGAICLTSEDEQGHYILKPAPGYKELANRDQMPANEHLTMQIARQVYGLATAENALVFFQNGVPAYLTKRFDIHPDGTKTKQEDFASLAQKTGINHGPQFKYDGSYTEMGELIKKYVAAWQVEMGKFFKQVLFNYLFGNGDAHLKNFSLQQSKNGDYLLSPAYDLLNTSLHVNDDDFALKGGLFTENLASETYRLKGHPCKDDFILFGEILSVPKIQIDKILKVFAKLQPLVGELTERSFLNEKLKRMYLRSYQERLDRLNRTDKEQ